MKINSDKATPATPATPARPTRLAQVIAFVCAASLAISFAAEISRSTDVSWNFMHWPTVLLAFAAMFAGTWTGLNYLFRLAASLVNAHAEGEEDSGP